MKKVVLLFFLNMLLLSSFAQEKMVVIDIPSSLPKEKALMSQYFQSVRYLPLETTDECLLERCKVRLLGNYILAWDYFNFFLFNAKNGKFIRKIGHKGDDPEAYAYVYSNFFNPYNQSFYIQGYHNNFQKYALDGKYLKSIQVPLCANFSTPAFVEPLTSSIFCAFFSNTNGAETKRVMLFDEKGGVVKIFPNPHIIKTNKIVMDSEDGISYRYKGKVYFKEKYIDTVYQITEKQLIPEYVLNFSRYSVPYKDRYNSDPNVNVSPYFMCENDNYIMFEYVKDNKAQLGVIDKKLGKSSFYLFEKGFVDDINHFMGVGISSMSDDGVCLGILYPVDITKYIEDNKIDFNDCLRPLKGIDPEDNPVIVFMECR